MSLEQHNPRGRWNERNVAAATVGCVYNAPDFTADLKQENMSNRYAVGASDTRPWGHWAVIDVGPTFTVKRITVNPDGVLSLQLHHGRSEHWTVVSGTAEVTLDDRIFTLQADGTVYIPAESKHRIANRGTEPLVFIEVQCGRQLDENDIVRFEDQYGRAGKN